MKRRIILLKRGSGKEGVRPDQESFEIRQKIIPPSTL